MDGRRHIALRGLLHGTDAAVEVGDALGDHIGQILLVEVVGGVDGLVVDADHLGGYADGGAVGGQVLQHHAARADAGIVADVDRAKHLGSCADQHVVAQRGVALAGVLAGAAQRDAVVDGAVVADLSRLAEDDAHAVVDEQAPADPGTGVDLDAGLMPAALADPSRQKKVPALIQPVRDAVIDQNVKAGVQQNDLQHAARGGVLALDVPCVLQ